MEYKNFKTELTDGTNDTTPCDKAAEEYANRPYASSVASWDKEAFKAGWSACNELMQSRIAELEAVYQQLKTKYMNEWDRVALEKKQIQSLEAKLAIANELMQSRISELESEIKTFERADRIEANSFEERCSEASHYSWLDDKIHEVEHENFNLKNEIQSLEAKLAIANELINNVAGQVTWCDPTNQKVVLTYGFIVPDCQKYVAAQLTKESK